MVFDWQFVVTVISLVVAIASALYARRAAKSAENTFTVELILQLYSTYQSKEMRDNLRTAWKIYHKLWAKNCATKEEAKNNANAGLLLPQETANEYFLTLKIDSTEYKAIHYVNNFWTYVELLLKKRALKSQDILAFTSPRILGFCLPMARAHRVRYPEPTDSDDKTILEYAYKVLCKMKR